MLGDFIKKNHDEIIARARERVALRSAPRPTDAELDHGLPLFLDQLVEVLRRNGDGEAGMADSALKHGADLSRMGFTIAQVVHDYGDLCQTITSLALEHEDAIPTEDFKTLNRCLDDAIAEAVSEYSRLREVSRDQAETERLGFLAHELRNKLNSAMLAYGILKEGQVGMGGSTGAVLDRSLKGLQDLITRSLTEVRVDSGAQHRERINVNSLVEDIELEGSMDARSRKQQLTVEPVESGLEVDADRALLAAALTNLLTNAFKFSPINSHISLRTSSTKDHCDVRGRGSVRRASGDQPRGDVPALDPTTLRQARARHGTSAREAECPGERRRSRRPESAGQGVRLQHSDVATTPGASIVSARAGLKLRRRPLSQRAVSAGSGDP